jgi:hypothetical protein
VSSAGQDSFAPGSGPTVVGQVLGWNVTGVTIAWVEGVPSFDPMPPFLASDALPASLPANRPQLTVSLAIPGLTPIIPTLNTTGFFGAYLDPVSPVAVPEPGPVSLLALGVAAIVFRRRARLHA